MSNTVTNARRKQEQKEIKDIMKKIGLIKTFLKNESQYFQGFQGLRYRGVIYLYYFPLV
jgi:hypothetical protein